MLKDRGVPFDLREYSEDPLSAAEIHSVLERLALRPKDVLRTKDPAYKENGLTGQEDDEILVALMAQHPTLLQRPIALLDGKAMVARPADKLLEWID